MTKKTTTTKTKQMSSDDYLRGCAALVAQISRMSLQEEAIGDMGNDAAMDGLIKRARILTSS